MVRLKVPYGSEGTHYRTEFQFLYGTIESKVAEYIQDKLQQGFNSSMVRLKDGLTGSSQTFATFQFLYGTIERIGGRYVNTIAISFQFLYGTIESAWLPSSSTVGYSVSIPLWYD